MDSDQGADNDLLHLLQLNADLAEFERRLWLAVADTMRCGLKGVSGRVSREG